MVGAVSSARLYEGLAAETTLDPKVQPFLFDHAMDDTPLLPGVMGTETFAELASVVCPGFRVSAVEDEQFLLPFKYFRKQPATLYLSALAVPDPSGDFLVEAFLRSRVRPKPELAPVERIHFRARVRMTRAPAAAPAAPSKRPPRRKALPIGPDAIYRVFFHGPAYRVLEGVALDGDTAWGLMAKELPPNAVPGNTEALMAPRLIELCFQTAGIQEAATKNRLALPMALDSVRVFGREEDGATSRLWAVVTARDGGTAFDAHVVDENGRVFAELRGYRAVPLPGTVTLT
jgi:hypothetical protein